MACMVETRDIVGEVDIRSVLPEVTDLTVVVRAPELKSSNKGYWHMGTSRVTRVKIDALCPGVKINAKNATKISGTSAEFWQPVQTLGTALINIFHCGCIPVHVTPSTAAPFTADGIIGRDLCERENDIWHWKEDWGQTSRLIMGKPIPNCMRIMRNHMHQNSIPILTGSWALSSRQLDVFRLYLPPEVGQNGQLPIFSILDDYSDCFHLPGEKLGATSILSYPIELGDTTSIPVVQQPAYYEELWDEIESHIRDLLKHGIIKRSKSSFNFAMGLATAIEGLSKRIVVDYSTLNEYLKVKYVPRRAISTVTDELHGQKYFSVFHLASASYQIKLQMKDHHKTAFTTRCGRYEFQRMPDDIEGSFCYIQRLMNIVLKRMKGKARACDDNIIVYAPTIEEHEIRLRQVLARIRDAGLSLQPAKIQTFSKSVKYLFFNITDKGWFPHSGMIKKLKTTPLPTNAKDLKIYLNLVAEIERFIPNYTDIMQPMFNMLVLDDFSWTKEALVCFRSFQSSLSTRLLLRYPNWNRKFHFMTSVSKYGFQVVVKQKAVAHRAKMHPIAYASRKFKDNEINLDADKLKVIADTWSKKRFRRYCEVHQPILL